MNGRRPLFLLSLTLNGLLGYLAIDEFRYEPTKRVAVHHTPEPIPLARNIRQNLNLEVSIVGPMEPQEVADRLRQAGFPEKLVGAAVGAALDEKYKYDEVSAAWRVGYPGSKARMAEYRRLVNAGLKEIIGLDVENGPAVQRKRRLKFGDLEESKVKAVEAIEKEWRKPKSESTMRNRLLTVLTPDEVEDYFMFNSDVAEETQHQLAILDIDEDTYRQIYAAEREYSKAPRPTTADDLKRMEQYRSALGDERFLQISTRVGRHTHATDVLVLAAGLDQAAQADLFIKTHVAMVDVVRTSGTERQNLARALLSSILNLPASNEPGTRNQFQQTFLGRTLTSMAGKGE